MRDFAVTAIVLMGVFYTLKKPYIGVLLWAWLSYMNPHRLCYGFAYSMPFAQVSAIAILFSLLYTKQKQSIIINKTTVIWIVFLILMLITTYFAFYNHAWNQFYKVIKIQLLTFITMMLITDYSKLNKLIWVIVLSIGYYSVKGGVFTILTGGKHIVWGPSGSFIEDNNGLAVAILMTIPLMVYLYQTEENKWIKRGLIFAIVTSLFTVLGSQSRGALIAILSVGGFYWTKSKNKLISGAFILFIGFILLLFMPESWYKRMDTISSYEEDASAMGRLNAWEYALNAANDNILGLGFNSWNYQTFVMYAPNPTDVHAAHSIYFTVLADHGWIGLFLFVAIFLSAWTKLNGVLAKVKYDEKYRNYDSLGRMLQVSFIAYATGGAFLSLSYFDLPWHLVCFVVLIESFVNQGNRQHSQNLVIF